MVKAATKSKAKVQASKAELTKPQDPRRGRMFASGVTLGQLDQGDEQPGTYANYRRMETNPIIAIAMMVQFAPLRSVQVTVEGSDNDTPKDRVDFVFDQVKKHWHRLLKNMLLGVSRGFQAFEKVWEPVSRTSKGNPLPQSRLGYKKLKPLLQDLTEIMIDKDHGEYRGVKNQGVELSAEDTLLFVNDQEGTDYYGRPRQENVRQVWSSWLANNRRMGNYSALASSPIPMVEYPEGTSIDGDGQPVDNQVIAQSVVQQLSSGNGVVMPNTLARWAEDAAKTGVDMKGFKAWLITFLEPSNSYGSDFIAMLEHFEALMARGWFTPERAFAEGTGGTKAETESNVGLTIAIAQMLASDIEVVMNDQFIDPLLIVNYGEEARGTVVFKYPPLHDETPALIRDMIKEFFRQPANADLFMQILSVQEMVDSLGIPRKAGVDVDDVLDDAADDLDEVDDPAAVEAKRQAELDEKKKQQGKKAAKP